MRKHIATSALAGLILAIVIALSANTIRVSAHAFLLRTEPSDGSVLLSAPEQMRFWFSEPLEIELTTITLQDGEDHTWELQSYADANDPSIVIADLPDLPPSAYRVTWRTVSDEDLHVILGFVVFGIQQPVSRVGSGQTQNATPFAEVTFHWIGLLSFAAMLGTLIVVLFLLPSVRKKIKEDQIPFLSSLQSKMILSALWFSIVAFIAGLAMLWEKSMSIQATAGSIQNFDWKLMASLANIVYIQRELASEGCLITIVFLMIYWLKQERAATQQLTHPAHAKIRNILLFSFTFLWIFLQSMNSHALAFNDFSIARVLAYAFHLLGASFWIGGQTALIFLVAPRLQAKHEQRSLAREIYVQFGGIAALGVAILIVTGLYSGGQQVASLDALLLTDYGKALVLKTVIFVLAGLIGLAHAAHFHLKVAGVINRLIPKQTARLLFGAENPTSTLRIELLGGVAIFLLAAFLGSTQPARGPEFEAPLPGSVESTQPVSSSSMADDLLVNFSIKPNQPGQNFITVGVFDTRRPSPAPVEQVVVRLLPPGKQAEIQLDATLSDKEGTYQISTGAINLSGDWEVSVIVHRTGLEDAVLDLPWRVAPSAPATVNRPIFVSSHPFAPLLTVVSLLLSVLLGGIWLAVTLKPDLFHRLDRKAASSSREM